jgi:hypothetical protein
MANRYKLELEKNMPMAYNYRNGMYMNEDGRMGRRKKGDNSERTDKRERRSLQVQLYMDSAKEKELADYYTTTKRSGKWRADFINAMRLFLSLENGSTKVLKTMYSGIADAWEMFTTIKEGNFAAFKELFPDLYQAIRLEAMAEIQTQVKNDSYKDLLQEVRAIQAKLDNLKSTQALGMPQSGGGIKPLNVPQFAAPIDDDDDLVLTAKKDESAGFKANENFLKSMMNLQK